MIKVKGCKSMQVLRNQSRNDVLTIVAFISGHPSDDRATAFDGTRRWRRRFPIVMAGLDPAIHAFVVAEKKGVDARVICAKTRFALLPGHDDRGNIGANVCCHHMR
jgi:hypothetical protein